MEPTTEQVLVEQNTPPTTNLSSQTVETPPVSHSKIIIVAVGLCIVAGSASALYYYKDTIAPSLFAPKATLKVDKSLIIATSTSEVQVATTSKPLVESSSTSEISPDHFTQSDFTESDILGRWTDKEGKGDNDWELIIDTAGKHIYKGYGKDGKLDCTDTWEMNNGMLTYTCGDVEYKKDKSYVPFTISLAVDYNKVTGELTVVDEGTTSVWKRSGGVKNNTTMINENILPDLSAVTSARAKEIITEYFTVIKPERDELKKQIPGGILTFHNDKANVSDELAKKWLENSNKYGKMAAELTALSKDTNRASLNINSSYVNLKIYVNESLAYQNTESTSGSSFFQLQSVNSYAKYIENKDSSASMYLLKKGNNTVKVDYTLDTDRLGLSSISTVFDEPLTVTIKEMKMTADNKLANGEILLTLQEKPIAYKNGVFDKNKGTLTGTFILK